MTVQYSWDQEDVAWAGTVVVVVVENSQLSLKMSTYDNRTGNIQTTHRDRHIDTQTTCTDRHRPHTHTYRPHT